MKKLFFYAAMFVAAASVSSCVSDADVNSGTDPVVPIEETTGTGNVEFQIVARSSDAASRADAEYPSGENNITRGVAAEFKVNKCKVFLFQGGKLVQSIDLKGIGEAQYGSGTDQYVWYYPEREKVAAGSYDVLAVANKDVNAAVGTSMDDFLKEVDDVTYAEGLYTAVPAEGFIMTNRGAENLGEVVRAAKGNTTEVSTITISLERVIARVDVTTSAADASQVKCADVEITDLYFMNLADKYYTFRHVAALDAMPTAEPAWSNPTNFTVIPTGNGYVWDPTFLKKTPHATADEFKTAVEGLFKNPISKIDASSANWKAIANGQSIQNYINENTMYKTAQHWGNSTGIQFRASVAPKAENVLTLENPDSKTFIQADKSKWENAEKLYYFNYNFYLTIQDLIVATGRSNLRPNMTADELAGYDIRVYKMDGGKTNCYYVYIIRHLNNNDPQVMGDMEFAVVRNHLYNINIKSITKLGPGEPYDDPTPPDEAETYLKVDLNVRPWVIVNDENIEF